MDRKIKVLHIVATMGRGGIETFLMNMLRTYDRANFQMDICYTNSSEGVYAEEVRQLDTRLLSCRMRYDLVRDLPQFIRLLHQGKYDIIDVHSGDFAGPALMAAKWASVPGRVASYHNVQGHYRTRGIRKPYIKLMRWMTEKYSNAVTGCSKAAMDAWYPGWQTRKEKMYKVCYCGIDYKKFAHDSDRHNIRKELNLKDDAFVIGHVGGLREPKNHKALIQVAQKTICKYPNVVFVLVGEGPMRGTIQEWIGEAGIADNVILTGQRGDIPRVMSAFDVFFFPSIDEGFGLVLIEAQAAGLPVLGSSIPAIMEAVNPAARPLLREPLDHEGLAESLDCLIQSAQLREKLVTEGRQFANAFDINKSVQNFQKLYMSLL